MSLLMGVDLGTSSIKVLVMDKTGIVKSITSQEYSIDMPQDGYAEQQPENWWNAAVKAIRESVSRLGSSVEEIKCIGFSGQMHGLLLLDKEGDVIRPAIIHCDQRSKPQVDKIYHKIGIKEFGQITLNPLFPGLFLSSLLWVKENEPRNYEKIHKAILPKDYLRFKLTGEIATESTDASGSLALNTSERRWSKSLISQLDLDYSVFPECMEPCDIAGCITPKVALETGLKKGTATVYGLADQPAQALGNGIIKPGIITSTVGTARQIYAYVDKPIYNPLLNTHTFCNITHNTWYVMGAILNAGLALGWFKDNILHVQDFRDIDKEAASVTACCEGIIFLPYLTGERTPHMNSKARGMFFGLTPRHNRAHMSRAIMEGITFALRDCIETMEQLGIPICKVIASGGGAKSRLWQQIQADVFGRDIYTTKITEQACTGAAMAAGIGYGVYSDINEACDVVVRMNKEYVQPIKENVEYYNQSYNIYRQLYLSNKHLFSAMSI